MSNVKENNKKKKKYLTLATKEMIVKCNVDTMVVYVVGIIIIIITFFLHIYFCCFSFEWKW